MKVLLVGGGTGGHITPLLAVAKQLEQDAPSIKIDIVSERFGKFGHLLESSSKNYGVHHIFAGKFRRYHGQSFKDHVLDIGTVLLNIRDFFLFIIGFFEAVILILRLRPDIIFIKGGYVGVPVGYAARLFRISYITHDSDSSAGLANRLIGKHAKVNAVGMPSELYDYPIQKAEYVGVPISSNYDNLSSGKIAKSRTELNLKNDDKLLIILGGSLGAKQMDKILINPIKQLLINDKNLRVIHQVGEENEDIYEAFPKELKQRIEITRYLDPLAKYLMAADVVVSRAGATTIAELAATSKAVVLIPAIHLSDGHQIKNAEHLAKSEAAVVFRESSSAKDQTRLQEIISRLLNNSKERSKIAIKLNKTIPSDATKKISRLIINVSEGKNL